MILIDKINISYGSHAIIKDLELELGTNQIHGLVGLNGAGKSTLLNSMFGLKKADSGRISLDGYPVSKKNTSYLPTEVFYYSLISGSEYLSLFKNDGFDLDKWNELFGLPLDELVDGYSTGVKKKLAVMAMLKEDKPLLILDEPFNGLDLEACYVLQTLLLKLKSKGKTIIITSHVLQTLTNMCDAIHFLEDGVIKYSKEKSGFVEFEKELADYMNQRNDTLINELINS